MESPDTFGRRTVLRGLCGGSVAGLLGASGTRTTAALDPEDESLFEAWRLELDVSYDDPVAEGPDALYATDEEDVTAYSYRSGEERWRATGEGGDSLVAADGVVFAVDQSSTALDAATGEPRWETDYRVYSAHAAGDRYAIGTGLSGFIVVDRETGSVQAEFSEDEGFELDTTQVILDGDTLYVGKPADDTLLAGDIPSGTRRWRFDGGGRVSIREGQLFVGSNTGRVYGLDPQTGEETWRWPDTPIESFTGSAARVRTAVLSDTPLAFHEGVVHRVDVEAGTSVWTFDPGDRTPRTRLTSDGEETLFVRTEPSDPSRSGVAALEADGGERRWSASFEPADRGPSNLLYDGSVLYAAGPSVVAAFADGEFLDAWSPEVPYPEFPWLRGETVVLNDTGRFLGVRFSQAPSVQLTVDPSEPVAGETVTLTADATGLEEGQPSYEWTTPGSQPDAASVDVTFSEAGTYDVGVTVTDTTGRSATASRSLRVMEGSAAPANETTAETSPGLGAGGALAALGGAAAWLTDRR